MLKLAPIRKSVIIMRNFEIFLRRELPEFTISVLPGRSRGRKVIMAEATMKYGINHGMRSLKDFFSFSSFFTAKKLKNNVTGTIHNALASFTVVPISRASSPYAIAAPTTELVSCMPSAAQ